MQENTNKYDVIIIGAGSGGLTSAVGFAKLGKRVLLVEREHMGGECTNTGCIPSKALLHKSAELAGQDKPDSSTAFAYTREKIQETLAEETPQHFEEMGIDVVMGEARFTDKCTITVDGTSYNFKRCVIATGSSPRMIDIDGLDEQYILTNQNIFDLQEAPARTLIIGSGPIGLEMSQALAQLGSEVTVATIDNEIGRLEDAELQPLIRKSLESCGVRFLTSAYISHVDNTTAHFDIKDSPEGMSTKNEQVEFDKVLIAIGRVPNIPKGLSRAGIEYTKQGITTNRNYRTSNKYVYAIGDVSQALKFTHTADDAGRHVVSHAVSWGLFTPKYGRSVPKITYTTPEIGQVGLSWDKAIARYGEDTLLRISIPYFDNDRARTDEAQNGRIIVFAKCLTGRIVGANIVGKDASALIAILGLAIDQRISLWKLRNTIFAYPTYALLLKKVGDQFLAHTAQYWKRDIIRMLGRHLPKITALIFWIALFAIYKEYQITHGYSYTEMTAMLFEFFTGTIWGPILYMVLYALRPLIFFPATLLTALSGALFGLWWGLLYTALGENASANFAYWIGRFFGKDAHLTDGPLGGWVTALRAKPFEAVLFMRLFYVPFDLTNYGSGILKVPWKAYTLATAIGIIPGMATFVALGASIKDINNFSLSYDAFSLGNLALAIGIFIASILLARYLRRAKII